MLNSNTWSSSPILISAPLITGPLSKSNPLLPSSPAISLPTTSLSSSPNPLRSHSLNSTPPSSSITCTGLPPRPSNLVLSTSCLLTTSPTLCLNVSPPTLPSILTPRGTLYAALSGSS